MPLSYDDFYTAHLPQRTMDLLLRSQRVVTNVRMKLKHKRSFLLVSAGHGYGKHVLIRLLLSENDKTSAVWVNEDTDIASIERNDEVTFDMTNFLTPSTDTETHDRRDIFVVKEEVIKSVSCVHLLRATVRANKQCVFLYTSLDIKKDPKIKRLLKEKNRLSVIWLCSIPQNMLMSRVCMILQSNRVLITKRAAAYLAKHVYGNFRILLMLVHRLLQKAESKNITTLNTPHVLEISNESSIDSFCAFTDMKKRCMNKRVYSFEERFLLCAQHSYAVKNYCYTSVTREHRHPWHSKKLNIHDSARWMDLFSLNDALFNYNREDTTFPCYLLL